VSRSFRTSPPFPEGARAALSDPQLRTNLGRATSTIRARRRAVIAELPDFEELRESAEALKNEALDHLDVLLVELEDRVTQAGGHVHFARDAAEARKIVTDLVAATGEREVVKVKSMTTAEIELNSALEDAGIDVKETDLAELIVQLADDLPSHIVVPAIHRNRHEIRDIFVAEMGKSGRPAPDGLSDEPADLASAARAHLRERFLRARVAISGANFAIAESGSLVVVESEGNGRMCLTLVDTLISVVGIDKVLARFEDLEVFLQLLPRSATGERMNPYTSIWTGVSPGDGPQKFHLVLLDNGRSHALADRVGRQALRCIRCAACLNVCPVYERVGGHAYGSVYPGPIGAVLTPQLKGVATDSVSASLPFASTLCGACFEVCPVRIDIPRLLVHLRGEVVNAGHNQSERVVMAAASWAMADGRRFGRISRLGAFGGRLLGARKSVRRLPGPLSRWTAYRDAPVPARQSFRQWWRDDHNQELVRSLVTSEAGDGIEISPKHRIAISSSDGGQEDEMKTTSNRSALSRSVVLDAVRSALTGENPRTPPIVRSHVRAGQRDLDDPIGLFCERLQDYKATVRHVNVSELPGAIADVMATRGIISLAVPPDLPDEWLTEVVDAGRVTLFYDQPPIELAALDGIGSTLTGCAVAIAETGTIILDGGRYQGRRVLTLVPDHHLVIVRTDQIVPGVPDAVAKLRRDAPQTWISGPSATSDIELSRVEGVHGPRQFDVLIVTPTGGQPL
jgi:L-lactate dehydrogenase complex protein LldF